MACFVVELGAVYGWGMGSTKQLGQGDDEDDKFEPVIIGGKQLQKRFVFAYVFIILYAFVSFSLVDFISIFLLLARYVPNLAKEEYMRSV